MTHGSPTAGTADTSYGALSMDDIAQHACVAKGLVCHHFKSKRGHHLAIVEESVAEPVARAAAGTEPAGSERARRTIDGHLYDAEHHRARDPDGDRGVRPRPPRSTRARGPGGSR
ncbi:TetR/AcrR family transcriptional regulator [Streptomyces sp. NPDC002602]|uniref:TetR/AcrR family transcriptional regulator n=1 Tax=Streptomyces sp. NPDC002602 TaxID=3364654 RepID=UPI0036B14657